ncbi:MAG: hypothetical protein AB7P04_10510 [Bacteriovoracia bacterium]
MGLPATRLPPVVAAIMALILTPLANAHPVAYPGAIGVMTWNQSYLADHWLTYSFSHRFAVAARYMRMTMRDGEFRGYLAQADWLLQRWNGENLQANVYLFAGGGGMHFDGRNGAWGLTGLEIDAESRSLFGLAKYEGGFPSHGQQFHHGEFCVGVAPYEAEFDELAAWFMLHFQYHPLLVRNYALTPMARFYYKNVLWETGVSFDGDWMLNLMFHF